MLNSGRAAQAAAIAPAPPRKLRLEIPFIWLLLPTDELRPMMQMNLNVWAGPTLDAVAGQWNCGWQAVRENADLAEPCNAPPTLGSLQVKLCSTLILRPKSAGV
jgi:hypothetical protein